MHRAHMELSRLAKKHDRAGKGEAMLGPGQSPFLKLTVHEP